jgi:prepilin-type processing-associated H-X9-DG protein
MGRRNRLRPFHFADASSGGYSALAFLQQVAVTIHQGSANYLFADGHVASLRWTQARALLPPAITRFVRPDNQATNSISN